MTTLALLLSTALLQDPFTTQATHIRQFMGDLPMQNGYRDYLEAAALMNDSSLYIFNNEVRTRETGQKTERFPLTVPLLEVKRESNRWNAKILELIASGNRKELEYRAEVSAGTLFFHLQHWRRIADHCERRATAELAEGNGKAALAIWTEGAVFSRRIQRGTIMEVLVGGAAESSSIAFVQKNLYALPIELDKTVASLPDTRAGFRDALQREKVALRNTWADIFSDPKRTAKDLGLSLEDDEAEALHSMPLNRREAAYKRFFGGNEANLDVFLARIEGSPTRWLDPLPQEKAPAEGLEGLNLTPTEEKALKNFTLVIGGLDDTTDYSNVLHAAVRRELKRDILKLTTQVLRFRWEQGRLPNALSEAFGQTPADRVTNKPYIYTRNGDGTFKIEIALPRLGVLGLATPLNVGDPGAGPINP